MKKIFKRGMSGLLAVLMAFTMLAGFGTTTAFAASETAESYMISFPRDGDAAQIYSEDAWGHSAKTYMNGWTTGSSNYTTLHCMDSFDGKVCYCIEPGLSRNVGDTYYGFGEDFWDNYPSQYNNTIEPDDIKLLLGRIMQYGYQGNLSTSWRSQNDSDADKLAHTFATQLLVWETVVGERDADFDYVSTGGYDTILSVVSPNHPLYSRIMEYYDSIESSVQSHAVYPSFMSRSSGSAKTIELAWDGSQYIAELTDTNRVLSQFTFSASETGFHFSVSGNTLTIITDTAPTGNVTISASRSASRCGVLVWTDYKYGPNGGVQDTVTYTASVSDPVKAFVKLKVSYGSAKIIKTSEDGKVDGITFTITGEGVNQTVTTDRNGEIRITNVYRNAADTGTIPTLCTLRDMLLEQPEPEAKQIALSLELYTTGSLDIFGKQSNVDLDKRVVVFDIHGLGAQLKPTGLLVITDTMLNRVTLNWKKGKRTHVFIDEFHVVFENEFSAQFFNSAWRQFRKRNAYPTAITQNVEYLLDSVQASTMLSNSEFVVMLNQAASDRGQLAKLLNISNEQMSYITNADAGCGLIKYGSALVPFINRFPQDTKLYQLMTTRPGEGKFARGRD